MANVLSIVRFAFFCYFGYLSLMLFVLSLVGLQHGLWNNELALPGTVALSLVVVSVGIYAKGCWVAFRERRSETVKGRGWLIDANVLGLTASVVMPLIQGLTGGADAFWSFERFFWLPQMIGIIGLFVFSRRFCAPAPIS